MNTLEILKAGRAKIALEANFTQGRPASNSIGRAVWPHHPSACKWCSEGALVSSVPEDSLRGLLAACDALGAEMDMNIPDFNDNHTHAEVLAAWDAAIEKEEAK